jgi:hypothetical protein
MAPSIVSRFGPVVVVTASIAASLAAPAQAQVWGTSGAWQLVEASGSGPVGTSWRHAATTAGCFFTLGGDGAGGNATFQYDPTMAMWTKYPDLPVSPRHYC